MPRTGLQYGITLGVFVESGSAVRQRGRHAVGAHESRVYRGPGGGGRRRTLPSAFQSRPGPHFPEFLSGREGEVLI